MNSPEEQSIPPKKSGIFHVGHRACWKITGADRVRYINGQVTQNVLTLAAGNAVPSALTTAKGRLISDLVIGATTDALWIDAPLERREAVEVRLQKYVIADDVVIEDVTGEWEIIHDISGQDSMAERAMFFRSDRIGVLGSDVWLAAGAPVPFPDIADVEGEKIRMMSGRPRWGRELEEETLPPEAGMDRYAISYEKGCYVGQETIARIRSIGHVNRNLVVLEGFVAPPSVPVPLERGGNAAGRITSATWVPEGQKWIALGMVSRQHAAIGNELTAGGALWRITSSPLPAST